MQVGGIRPHPPPRRSRRPSQVQVRRPTLRPLNNGFATQQRVRARPHRALPGAASRTQSRAATGRCPAQLRAPRTGGQPLRLAGPKGAPRCGRGPTWDAHGSAQTFLLGPLDTARLLHLPPLGELPECNMRKALPAYQGAGRVCQFQVVSQGQYNGSLQGSGPGTVSAARFAPRVAALTHPTPCPPALRRPHFPHRLWEREHGGGALRRHRLRPRDDGAAGPHSVPLPRRGMFLPLTAYSTTHRSCCAPPSPRCTRGTFISRRRACCAGPTRTDSALLTVPCASSYCL